MNPIKHKNSVQHVVVRLLRQWLWMKYNVNLDPDYTFEQCGGAWDDESIAKVLSRVGAVTVDGGRHCNVNIVTQDESAKPSFAMAHKYVLSKPNSATFPCMIVITKSGHWVLVSNAGHNRLQGHAFDLNESAFVDEENYQEALSIFDVNITKYHYTYCCLHVNRVPRLTRFYTHGQIEIAKQTNLDMLLLSGMDDYDNVLS